MRITHVYHSYYPTLGGLEKVVQKLAEEQADMGHNVSVITSRFGSRGPSEERANDVDIHRIRTIRFGYPDLAYPIHRPRRTLEDSDLVHIHSQTSLFNISLAKTAKRIGKRIAVDFLAVDYLKSHGSAPIRFFGGFYQTRAQLSAARLADIAITVNGRDHDLLRSKYKLQSRVIPHGLDNEYLTRPKDEDLFRKKFGVQSDNVIACVGRVHPSKGLDLLMKAASVVSRDVEDLVVVIAGEGSRRHRDDLRKSADKLGISRAIVFTGFITEHEKISLMDSSRAFVLPTFHQGECYSLVVDEAYARGVPVVATRVGVLPYRIRHLETGILVPPGKPLHLAKALLTILKDEGLLARMSTALRDQRESLLTWRQVCERMDDAYCRLPQDN